MMMKNAETLDLAERRERELSRVSRRDLELENALDDLLLELNEDDNSAQNAREVLETAASKAKAVAPEALKAGQPKHDPAKRLVESYYFPDVGIAKANFMRITAAERVDTLKILLGRACAYHQVREEYCALSLAMNECGDVPPKFRSMRQLPRRTAKATPDETLMLRDRQVIDMHWLHSRGKRDELPDRAFTTLFVDDELDFDMAEVLASKAWTNEIKAEKVLNLIPHEQFQLACLHIKAVADTWRNAENSMKTTIDRRLREQLVSEPSLKPHIEDLKLLWLAEKLMSNQGLSAVAKMHGWLSGKAPLSISTLSTKLKRMRRRTTAKGSRM